MDFIDALLMHLPEAWLVWVTAVLAVCAAVATVLPAPKADGARLYALLYKFMHLAALNRMRAKNARNTAAAEGAQTQTETENEKKES